MDTHGGYALTSVPAPDTDTFERSGFLMHGGMRGEPDPSTGVGTASLGCIIMARPVREQVWESGDRDLEVLKDASPDQEAIA